VFLNCLYILSASIRPDNREYIVARNWLTYCVTLDADEAVGHTDIPSALPAKRKYKLT
jgi:hypothetical protein